jgi:hypothetical protein
MVSSSSSLDVRKKIAHELHRQARKNFQTRKTLLKGLDDLYQADLVDMSALSRQNSNYKFILTIINCLSKVAYAFPLKQKSAAQMAKVLAGFFKKHPMRNFQTDQGTEFYNAAVGKLVRRYNINHYSTFSVKKAAIVERFNRTLKSLMYRHFTIQGSYKWLKLLPKLLHEYNHTVHRTIGIRPADVSRRNEIELLAHLNSIPKKHIEMMRRRWRGGSKFKVGDQVRISRYSRNAFRKSYLPNWSNEVFTIAKVQSTFPPTYLLNDARGEAIQGSFYNEELQKTSSGIDNVYFVEKVLRRKGDRVYVKWSGFDSTHNSWIPKSDLI